MKYFNLNTRSQTDFIDENITIPETDSRVSCFFDGVLRENEILIFSEDGFPIRRFLTELELNPPLTNEQKATQYQRDRLAEYQKLNQFEMQFNDSINGTTTWIDAINEIKAKYPKPE